MFAAVFVAASLCGCGASQSRSSAGRASVVTSFYPLAYAAEMVGGSTVSVENLTPPELNRTTSS